MNKLTKKWALGSKNFTSEGQKSPKNRSGSLALILKKIQKAIFHTLKQKKTPHFCTSKRQKCNFEKQTFSRNSRNK
jgi:hypothetical protein